MEEEKDDLLPMRMFFGLNSKVFYFQKNLQIFFKFIYKVNLSYFNGIRINLKTDGNVYKVQMNVDSDIEYNHQIYVSKQC